MIGILLDVGGNIGRPLARQSFNEGPDDRIHLLLKVLPHFSPLLFHGIIIELYLNYQYSILIKLCLFKIYF